METVAKQLSEVSHQPSGSTGVGRVASREPFAMITRSPLAASAGSASGSSDAAEKRPKPLRGSGEWSAEGEAGRGLLRG